MFATLPPPQSHLHAVAPATPPAGISDAQKLIVLFARLLARSGVHMTIRRDMAAWAETVEQMDGNDGANPTFDPMHSDDISDRNSFWIQLSDETGQTVACIAHRLFETPDFARLIRTNGLWYPKVHHLREQTTVLPTDLPRLGGRVGHGGGLVVARNYRSRGLSYVLPRLGRAIALRWYDLDWYTSVEMDKIAERGLPRVYGNAHTVRCIDGWFQARQMNCQLYLSFMSRSEMSTQQAEDAGKLIDHDCHDLVDLLAIVGQRQRQAPVVVQAVA
jgi:hypothetical protein